LLTNKNERNNGAGIAQTVEQRIRNAKVGGSIPLSGTSRFKQKAQSSRLGFLLSARNASTSLYARTDLAITVR
jgi:hypothetical protein